MFTNRVRYCNLDFDNFCTSLFIHPCCIFVANWNFMNHAGNAADGRERTITTASTFSLSLSRAPVSIVANNRICLSEGGRDI